MDGVLLVCSLSAVGIGDFIIPFADIWITNVRMAPQWTSGEPVGVDLSLYCIDSTSLADCVRNPN